MHPKAIHHRLVLQRETALDSQHYHISGKALTTAIRSGLGTRAFQFLLGPDRVDLAVSNILSRVQELSKEQNA